MHATTGRRAHGETGSSSTELVVVTPLLLLLVLVSVHVGLWFHARHVADAAATEGARAARAAGATDLDGHQRATALLAQLGTLDDVTVTVTRTAYTVTVEVSGTAPPVVPGLAFGVTAEATSPIEAFQP